MPIKIPQNFSWRSMQSQPQSEDPLPPINMNVNGGNDLMGGLVANIRAMCEGNSQEDIDTQIAGIEKNMNLYISRYGVICNDATFKALVQRELNEEYRNWMMSCSQWGVNPASRYIHTQFVTKFNPMYILELMSSVGGGSRMINE